MAALLLAAQPAEAQVVRAGTLVEGQTALCKIQQSSTTAYQCEMTVPGTGTITAARTSGKTGIIRTPRTAGRVVTFPASYTASGTANDAVIGTALWTITSTPNSGPAKTYAVKVVVYAFSSVYGSAPPGATLGFTASGGDTFQEVTPPDAPTNVRATVNGTSVVLTWMKPSGTITTYQVRQKKDSERWRAWASIPDSAALQTYTIPNLLAGSYVFRLRAINAGGGGRNSADTTVVSVTGASAAALAPVGTSTGTLVAGQTFRCLMQQNSYAICTFTVPGSGTIAVTGPNPSSASTILKEAPIVRVPQSQPRTVEFARANWLLVGNASRIGKGTWTITDTNGGTVTTYKVEVTVYAPPGQTGAPPSGTTMGVFAPGPAGATALKINFRNDSDGIVKPGQDVELTVTPSASVSRVTMQGLNLYAKKGTTLDLLGSQVSGTHTFSSSGTATLQQLLDGGAQALEISVPAGTPDGEYVVKAYGTTGVSPVERKLTVSSTLVEVSSVTFGPSAPRRAKAATEDTKGGGTNKQSADGYADDASLSEATTAAANGGSVEFTLSVLNPSGTAAEKSAVNSIFITTTHGTLTTSYKLLTDTAAKEQNVPATVKCGKGATCQIDLSGLASGALLPAKIRVLLEAPASPGAATVRATVVAGGKVHQPEPVTVTFTGPAKSLSIGEPPSTVLGYDVVGKDKDGNDVADDVTKTGHKPETGAASRDELAFMVQATDGAAGAGSVVKTPTLTVMVRDSAGALVATGKYQTKQSGALMNMLLLDIDAPKATPLKPGEYKLTLSSTSPALKAERMFTVVGDGSTLELELAPMSADTFGQTVTATARVQDAAGNPVAAGTAVTFKVSDFSGGNDAVAVLDTEGAVLTNKDGVASAVLTVVGAGNAVVRATADKSGGGSLLKTAVLVSRAGAPAAEGEAGLDCLSELSGFAVWTCGGSTASALFELLSARGATAIHLWNGSVWVRYSVVDGTMVPGSRDFTVGGNDVLYISN